MMKSEVTPSSFPSIDPNIMKVRVYPRTRPLELKYGLQEHRIFPSKT